MIWLRAAREINVDDLKLPVVKPGFFLWSPPPVATVAAVVEFRKARHKRQDSHHVFIVPRVKKAVVQGS